MTRKFKIIRACTIQSMSGVESMGIDGPAVHNLTVDAYRVLRLMGLRKGSEFTVSTTKPTSYNGNDAVKMVNFTDDSYDQRYLTYVGGKAVSPLLCHEELEEEFDSSPSTLYVRAA